ncbi:MAG: neutral/alkaline non-lysosomal ceramidase N-terminal domain-containing protein [Candidatus Nanopelagicaceae bacterium]|nr:neutral/alkaline non-lysosomal ceramidase N-terminal domain-containing protein [Candidatus Nanopelagicaceae bacterium]
MASTDSPNASLTPRTVVWREDMSALHMGIAQADVTPPVGIESGVWGASKHSRSESVHHGLFLTAVVREDAQGKRKFIVGIDLCVLGCLECGENLLTRIASELTIDQDDLLFSSSHSHSTPLPCIHRSRKDGSELVPGFIDQIVTGTVKACKEAAANVQDVDITWAYGKCDLAVNRDLPCGSQEVVAFNPDIPADDTLAVGRIADRSGKIIGTIANYACHPTTLAWDNRAISPDYVGEAREMVQEKTGAPMLFLQGASGDLSPRSQYSGETALADRHGTNLGHSILATLAAMQTPGHELHWNGVVESGALLGEWLEAPMRGPSTLKEARLDVQVRVKEMKSIQQLREEWAGIGADALEERIQRATRLRIGYESGQLVTHPVWVWQWGEAIFVAQPGEAYSYLQTELRKRNPDRIIFVMNLTNYPGLFYLPIKSAYVAPAYQAWQTLLAPGCIEEVVEQADKYIKESIGEKKREKK